MLPRLSTTSVASGTLKLCSAKVSILKFRPSATIDLTSNLEVTFWRRESVIRSSLSTPKDWSLIISFSLNKGTSLPLPSIVYPPNAPFALKVISSPAASYPYD